MTTTVTETYKLPDGSAARGTVTFSLSAPSYNSTLGRIVTDDPIVVNLDATGAMTVALEPTDSGAWSVAGLTYKVTERVDGASGDGQGRVYYVQVPTSGSAVKLGSLATWSPAPATVGSMFGVNVKDYGAKGDGVTDDTAAVQAAFNSVPSSGGLVFVPPGSYLAPSLTVPRRCKIVGAGARSATSPYATSEFLTNSPTGNLLTIAAHGTVIEDLGFRSTAASPSAGSLVYVTSGDGVKLSRISTYGGYYGVQFVDGAEWSLTDSALENYAWYGLSIEHRDLVDGGDMGVVNNQFISGYDRVAHGAVLWLSGGGLRFVGNKINARTGTPVLGLTMLLQDGVTTSVILVNGNTIEGCTYPIYLDHVGPSNTGVLQHLSITGNEFYAGDASIALVPAATGKLSNVAITGNVAWGGSQFATLKNTDQVTLLNNQHTGIPPLTLQGSNTGLYFNGLPFTTAGRPAVATTRAGASYYDTTLSKPVWSNGTNWKDAAGTNV